MLIDPSIDSNLDTAITLNISLRDVIEKEFGKEAVADEFAFPANDGRAALFLALSSVI